MAQEPDLRAHGLPGLLRRAMACRPEPREPGGTSPPAFFAIELAVADLPSGIYTCVVDVGGAEAVHAVIIAH
jgi:hypothetical protein